MKNYILLLLIFCNLFAISQNRSGSVSHNQAISKEVIESTKEFRMRLLADPYRPAYHFCFPEDDGRPGDPNGAFYANGRYHLMYLYNKVGKGFSWGHVSSTDLLHWRHHPDAIIPGGGDEGCFSGGAYIDKDGSATLSYWMLGDSKGIGLAKSNDLNFNSWTKFDANPVIQSTEWGITDLKDDTGKELHVGSADPSNIWKKDGKYYMITGNLLVLRKYGSRGKDLPANRITPPLPDDSIKYQGDHSYLFFSENMKDWKYLHEFYQSDRKWTDKTEDNMCPSFLPLPLDSEGGKPSGKHLLLFISHNKGCQYYVGTYKDDLFFPQNHGRMSWVDNSYFAPEALVDNKGRQIMWSWIFDDRPDSIKDYFGWNGTYGLPRSLWLASDGTLRMTPIKELESLRIGEVNVPTVKVTSGKEIKLNLPSRELMEFEVTINPLNAEKFGVKLGVSKDGREETVIYYDRNDQKLKFDTRNSGLKFGRKVIEEAPLELKKNELLKLRVFVDKSIIEVFANDRQAIARMVYPTLGGTGVSLFSEGGDVIAEKIRTWEINPCNPF